MAINNKSIYQQRRLHMDDKKKDTTKCCHSDNKCPKKNCKPCECEKEEKDYFIEGENLFDIRNYKR
jgi:hypothetical protein